MKNLLIVWFCFAFAFQANAGLCQSKFCQAGQVEVAAALPSCSCEHDAGALPAAPDCSEDCSTCELGATAHEVPFVLSVGYRGDLATRPVELVSLLPVVVEKGESPLYDFRLKIRPPPLVARVDYGVWRL